MSGSSVFESYDDDWNTRASTLDDDKLAEQNKFKASLSDLQKQSLDRTNENRNLGTMQSVSSTRIPTVKPVSSARWFQSTSSEHLPQQSQPNTEDMTPPPAPKEHHTKNHKLATEPKGRLAVFMDMLTQPFKRGK